MPSRGAFFAVVTLALVALSSPSPGVAQTKRVFTLAWSVYVGWVPWQWAADHGIVRAWASRYGITIEVVRVDGYLASVERFADGVFDAVTVTNMDALSIPAARGIDTTVVIVGDFSKGNDAIILKGASGLAAIRGRTVHLVERSVSHYLLARALQGIGMSQQEVRIVDTPDSDIVAAWHRPEVTAVVTWNPLVAEVLALPGAVKVFDSARIPGEIIDLTVANSAVLEANPAFGKALAGIWYETMAIMAADTPEGAAARAAMGAAIGTDRAGFEAQLRATRMFYDPAEAAAFTRGAPLRATMAKVSDFLVQRRLLGIGGTQTIGVAFADGGVLGPRENVTFRFTDRWMRLAADGALQTDGMAAPRLDPH